MESRALPVQHPCAGCRWTAQACGDCRFEILVASRPIARTVSLASFNCCADFLKMLNTIALINGQTSLELRYEYLHKILIKNLRTIGVLHI